MRALPAIACITLLLTYLPIASSDPAPPLVDVPFDAARAVGLREEWSQALKLPREITNSVGMKLLLIPGGRFRMGPNGSGYRVTLSRPFYLGESEVTLGQYRRWKPEHRLPGAEAEFNEADRPTAGVSWNEARDYCRWLSAQPEELAAGRSYALPTEAQWEWAARAGTETSRYFGETDKGQEAYSWFNSTYTHNPEKESGGRGRHSVKQLKPNAWGLYDMLGNVWEWCDDRRTDAATGEEREPVMRGGGWRSGAFHCTAVAHDPGDPNFRGDHIGFRIACRATVRGSSPEGRNPALKGGARMRSGDAAPAPRVVTASVLRHPGAQRRISTSHGGFREGFSTRARSFIALRYIR